MPALGISHKQGDRKSCPPLLGLDCSELLVVHHGVVGIHHIVGTFTGIGAAGAAGCAASGLAAHVGAGLAALGAGLLVELLADLIEGLGQTPRWRS